MAQDFTGLVARDLGFSDLFLRTLLEVGAIQAFRFVHQLVFRALEPFQVKQKIRICLLQAPPSMVD